MAENNPINYFDFLKNLPPDSNIDPRLMNSIITNLLRRFFLLKKKINERIKEIIDLRTMFLISNSE